MTNKEKPTLDKGEIAAIKSLETSIEQLHTEVEFGSNAFKGNVEIAQDLMNNATKTLISGASALSKLFEDYELNSKELKNQIATLSLLPTKTQEALKKLVPEIGKEIEKIHDQRMTAIESTLKELQQGLNEEAGKQLNVLKDLSKTLQKQFSESVIDKQKFLEQIASDNIEEIKKVQSQQIKQQEQMFREVVYHTQKEVESVTSNHGTKFFRNTAICLILATIMGGISGWYINRYMPKFVTLERTGDVTIHRSNVRVLEANKVKALEVENVKENDDLNKK